MDTKEKERKDTLEYVLDNELHKHYIYPMKLGQRNEVAALFAKINDEYPILNFPQPLLDNTGKVVLDDDGKEIENIEPYESMMHLLELALHDTQENIESWIDLGHISMILAAYRGLSRLKKKMEVQMKDLTGIPSMPD